MTTTPIRTYAMITTRSTGMPETGLCHDCYANADARARAANAAEPDVSPNRAWHDVSGNEEIGCTECGIGWRHECLDHGDTITVPTTSGPRLECGCDVTNSA